MSIEIKIPPVGESISEVTIATWLKQDGEYVFSEEVICEIDSDKATFEITTEKTGVLKILSREGETVAVGATIATIDTNEKARPSGETTKSALPEEAPQESTTMVSEEKKIKISPVAARILQEAGIPPEDVVGTGAGGRVTKEDALRALKNLSGETTAPAEAEIAVEAPSVTEAAPEEVEAMKRRAPKGMRTIRRKKLSTLRKTIARHLVAAKNQTAMLTTFNEVDMSAIMKIRTQYKEVFKEKYEVGLGFMSFFTRAVCIALSEFPEVNAMLEEDEIVYHDYCDIGIAVSTPRGLVVPVVRNAESMSLAEIEVEILHLATRARENKLTIEEMTGGTFTITNGGVFGSLLSTPIINAPQSAILGMHKIVERPVVVTGEVVVRPMMYVALSYDHRIIDGSDSVSFLVRVKELLEDPTRMLLEV